MRDLSQALADKRRPMKELERLFDPQDEARRAENLASAKEDVRLATQHAAEIETAGREHKLMELEAGKVRDDIARIDEVRARRAARDQRIATLETNLSEAEEDSQAGRGGGHGGGRESLPRNREARRLGAPPARDAHAG